MGNKRRRLIGWTNYPMTPEECGKPAPWRRCEIVDYDGNKMAQVNVDGIGVVEIKIGYVKLQPDEDAPMMFHVHPWRYFNMGKLRGRFFKKMRTHTLRQWKRFGIDRSANVIDFAVLRK